MLSSPTLVIVGWALGCAGVSFLLTGLVRQHALRHAIMDMPNHRSSHTVPTPRGGGLAIAITVLSAITAAASLRVVDYRTAVALIGGGAIIAAAGWADDRRTTKASTRFGLQLMAAAWAVFWLGGMPALRVGDTVLHLGLVGSVLAVLAIVWFTNLYNFMDGIDGIAGTEAVSAGSFACILLARGGNPSLALLAALPVGASLGFLVWNWPPARIFMGDVGSALLGLLFGVLALAGENSRSLPVLWWVVLFLVFVFDATVTLVRRAVRRDKVHTAHREHAYQRATANRGHLHVTLAVLAINLVLGLLALAAQGLGAPIGVALLIALGVAIPCYWMVERATPMFRELPQSTSDVAMSAKGGPR